MEQTQPKTRCRSNTRSIPESNQIKKARARDMNLNSKKWKKEDFDNKEIATVWLSGLAKAV